MPDLYTVRVKTTLPGLGKVAVYGTASDGAIADVRVWRWREGRWQRMFCPSLPAAAAARDALEAVPRGEWLPVDCAFEPHDHDRRGQEIGWRRGY